ncbi:hypothetical protein PGT21_001934 [Puccinia graminis f. sp. tritici]|uniref:Uncharacterized protein n=1 Tax=Puccinia graminis f. sp. tritici TaxID=56615 RepID=A0A5B0Q9E9_PUCGR|nr:hypothetical protein PGT21_001546 [Puccinia graminis f. sp. tritici]KAA1109896.1 hypothetical protein PGT21_001934 [Puccinia graminis f. sp. tritici]
MFGRNQLARSSLLIEPAGSDPVIRSDQLIGRSLAREEVELLPRVYLARVEELIGPIGSEFSSDRDTPRA